MKRLTTPLYALALFVVGLSAQGQDGGTWNVGEPCIEEQQKTYAETASRLLTAEPDDASYLPHPFPKTARQAFEDFSHQHRRATEGHPTSRPTRSEARLLAILDREQRSYRVTRVANWSPTRCGRHEERAFFWLFQIFDDGEEITRVAVSPSGLVASVLHWEGGPFADHPPPHPADPSELLASSCPATHDPQGVEDGPEVSLSIRGRLKRVHSGPRPRKLDSRLVVAIAPAAGRSLAAV